MKKVALIALIIGLVFFGCDPENNTNGNANEDENGDTNKTEFNASTDETVSNDVATLGLVGTTVSSDKPTVATAEITASAKIKITSVAEGSAVITVSDASSHTATINVSVSETGAITIGTIVKYTASNEDDDEEDDEEPQLPDPVGANELSGKIYSFSDRIVSFTEDNTYTFLRTYDNVIYITGFYSWNTPEKTVILVLEKSSGFDGVNLLNKSEGREMYIEYLSSFSPEELNLPPDTTIEQYADMVIGSLFSPVTYNYEIENGEIVLLSIKVTTDNGTTVAGCEYTEKAPTTSLGVHYLLSITFDVALSILTEEYGQPQDGWSMQSSSTLSDGNGNIDFVILEFHESDMRLTKRESGVKTTKGWIYHQ